MNISYSFGIIDQFHYGHLKSLQRASENSDLRVFGLVSDETATAWQGSIVSNVEERRAVVESIRYVDLVMLQKTFDPTDNIRQLHTLHPGAQITLYHGSDMPVIPAEQYLQSIGGKVEIVDYYEKMSPMNILEVLSRDDSGSPRGGNIISTKANTLIALKPRLRKSEIEDIYVCTAGQSETEFAEVFRQIRERFGQRRIVVRSSSRSEDCYETSNAGHFESVLRVSAADENEVCRALESVRASYARDGIVDAGEQILVQSQTENVVYSGVVFTRDIQNNRPYYVVNYDDCGKTDCVTSGAGGKTIWLARDTAEAEIPSRWKGLIVAVKEIEEILNNALLDIEFAICRDAKVVIFQVRPLAANYKYKRSRTDERILALKNEIIVEYRALEARGRCLLSDMAFWNPAEIIGTNPHPLDYSLYREIITHRAWNDGLLELNYRRVPKDLMYRLGNKPYICVNYAFRSLIPAELNDALTEKLVEYYQQKLSKDFSAHDKIEFEIVLSCYDFETEDRLAELRAAGFCEEELYEIRRALFDLTYNCIRNYPAVLQRDLASLRQLENVRMESEQRLAEGFDAGACVKRLEKLLRAIERYGTPQFSRQARCAFIAKALCRSMVSKGYLTEAEQDDFMSGISTVAKQFERDHRKLTQGSMSKEAFNRIYGHLRAGTYDIRSQRYDALDLASGAHGGDCNEVSPVHEPLPKDRIGKALKDAGLMLRPEEFEAFMRSAIEQREYFKFIFTRTLSLAIELIAEIGAHLDMERGEMSYLEVPQLLALRFYDNLKDMGTYLRAVAEGNRARYAENQSLILPEVVSKPGDLNVVHMAETRPNFVTVKSVHAPVVVLENDFDADLEGKIVAVEKADPGYDWIFVRGIAGLATKYGGIASHMAIRCAEFGIPAAIGCGEKIYEFIKGSGEITLDCKNGKIMGGSPI